MTKAELVALITHQTGVEKTAAEAVVEAFMRNIKETMIAGEDVFLRGFGSFIVKERAEKVARNITKNTTMVIPAHSIPAFKPSKVFLEAVKGIKKDKTLVLSGVAWYHSAPSDNEKRNRLSTAVAFFGRQPLRRLALRVHRSTSIRLAYSAISSRVSHRGFSSSGKPS